MTSPCCLVVCTLPGGSTDLKSARSLHDIDGIIGPRPAEQVLCSNGPKPLHKTRQGIADCRTAVCLCRVVPGHAPAEPEPDLDASLIDLVAEVERLQAGAEALSRGTPSPNPGSKAPISCRPHSSSVCSPHRGRELGFQWAHSGGSQLVRARLLATCFGSERTWVRVRLQNRSSTEVALCS